MTHIVTGLFRSPEQVTEAVQELKNMGYTDDVSIVSKQWDEEAAEMSDSNDATTNGAATGGVLGGLAGLIAGAGTVVAPGLGTVIVAGPLMALWGIAGAAAGALTGGIVGALVDAGVSEEDAQMYADAIKKGEVLVAVSIEHGDEQKVRTILSRHGALLTQTEHRAVTAA